MLREKWAPVVKNIRSRKPNFPLNTEKKWTSPITEVFQCHSMSALSLHLLLWRQLRTCLWKFILGLPLWPIDCALASRESPGFKGEGWQGRQAALKGQSGPHVLPQKPTWPFEGFKAYFLISSSAKLPRMMVLRGLKRKKIFLSIQKGTEHNPSWKEYPLGRSADSRCGMMWRRLSIPDSPKLGALRGIFGPNSSVYHNRTARIICII